MPKKKRKGCTIRLATPDDFHGLLMMYLHFEPKAEFQGLPPPTQEKIERWLSALLTENNVNFIIEVGRVGIVGHAVLCRDGVDRAELAIFLHQDYRRRRLGERLMEATVGFGCQCLHLKKIWLDVQALNYPAVALFRKIGFAEKHDLGIPASELIMDREVGCQVCKQEKCPVFDKLVPLHLVLADNGSAQLKRRRRGRTGGKTSIGKSKF